MYKHSSLTEKIGNQSLVGLTPNIVLTKAMHKPENSVIPCSAEIDLNGITTVGNLTEIHLTSETREFRRNLTEMLNRNGTGNKRPEV